MLLLRKQLGSLARRSRRASNVASSVMLWGQHHLQLRLPHSFHRPRGRRLAFTGYLPRQRALASPPRVSVPPLRAANNAREPRNE